MHKWTAVNDVTGGYHSGRRSSASANMLTIGEHIVLSFCFTVHEQKNKKVIGGKQDQHEILSNLRTLLFTMVFVFK